MNKQRIVIASSITVALLIGIVAVMPIQSADASANGEPTIWTEGVNAGQVHNYIYNVPPGSVMFGAALLIDDLTEKPNVVLSVTNPLGIVMVCPPVTGVLPVSECLAPAPMGGIWTVTVTGTPAIVNNAVGYAVAADTN